MSELHRLVKGRIAELKIASTLLALGHEVYAPLVDHQGIDFLVRRSDGSVDEIQVKSVGSGRWFQVQENAPPEAARRARRWVLCVESDGTTWVFPAKVFFDPAVAGVSSRKDGCFTYDLNLDSTRRGNKEANGQLLKRYRDAWSLLQ